MLTLFFWSLFLISFFIAIVCFFGMWISTVQREEIFMIFCEICAFSLVSAMLNAGIAIMVGLFKI